MKEIWKDVKEFEGLYQVSNFGRVKSLNYNHTGKGRVLNPYVDNTGYCQVSLYKNGKMYQKQIHRFVAETFIPNPNNLECVNHINGIKTDNRIENLEWCTRKENIIHALKNGLKKEYCTKKKPIHCLELNIEFESMSEAARYFNCSYSAIQHTLKGKTKQLRKKYTFAYV